MRIQPILGKKLKVFVLPGFPLRVGWCHSFGAKKLARTHDTAFGVLSAAKASPSGILFGVCSTIFPIGVIWFFNFMIAGI